ncbi:MAG: tRNA pseudouridine(55) synthase TruB [Bacteroidales bacterium]
MEQEYYNLEEYLRQVGTILPMDKPMDWTSFDVTNKVRVHLKHREEIPKMKAGHAGTLDPLATGLLLVCIGKATKQITRLQEMPKTYTGTILLGVTTPSFDGETEISATAPTDHITPGMILDAATRLTGPLMQVPPLFSAVKIEGRRAYKMARNHEDVSLPARAVEIYHFQVTEIVDLQVHFEIECSKGTYIRAVARDLGEMLGSCAYLTSLRRTRIGDYRVENAWKVEQLDEAFRHLF